jgi:tetratricopeptide (TPR) repeat protein
VRDPVLWTWRSTLGVVLAAIVFLTGSIRAQDQSPKDQSQDALPVWHKVSIEEQTARAVQRLALLELRMQPSPSPADYQIAMRTLELARELTPDDVELARRIVAAAWGTGETEALVEATRALLRLDPSDTVAQLRLITARIARAQTAEERLSLYEKFLGPSGARLDPSVRSRLALDAALLLREQGNDEQFVAMLNRAMTLDGTNKAAAQLALTFYSGRVSDPVGRFEMMLHLLYADPLDPNVHLAIAQELADHGVMSSAERFHNHAATLYRRSGSIPPGLDMNSLSLRWQIYGPESTLGVLNKSLGTMREQAQARYDAQIEMDVNPDELVDPSEVRIDLEKEKVRIISAMAAGDEETVAAAMKDMQASVGYAIEQLMNLETRPQGYSEADALNQGLAMSIQLQIYRFWTGVDEDVAVEDTQLLHDKAGKFAFMLNPIDPWLLLHEEKYEDVIARVEELGQMGGRLAHIARALALEKLGRKDEAREILFGLARSNGLAPSSAWARWYAIKNLGEQGLRTESADGIEALANDVPRFVDDMIADTSSFMSFRIEVLENPTRVNMPWHVRIRLRNLSPVPLSLGSDRPINSRVLLQPHRDNNVEYFFKELFPEVVELNRRLRLEPYESIDATISVDLGASGMILALNSLNNHRITWRALQGFVIGASGSFQSGPMCKSAESTAVEVLKNPMKRLSAQETGVTLRNGSAEELPDIIALVRSVLLAWPLRTPRDPEVDDTIRDASAARLQETSPIEQAFMLASLPASRLELAMVSFDDAALALPGQDGFRVTTNAALVESLVLLTRVTDPASPLLDEAIERGSEQVAAIARLVRDRLTDGRPCYARTETIDDWFPTRNLRNK